MVVLALIGFGPLSLTCLIGIYVLIARPLWFYAVVQNLYRGLNVPVERIQAVQPVRLKCFLCLLALLVLDIAPVPVTGAIGLYVILTLPDWFYGLVERIYADN